MSVTTVSSATVADTAATYLKNVFAVSSFAMGGDDWVLAGSYTEAGISLFRLEADGTLTNTANAATGISAEAISAITTASGKTFAFIGGQQNGLATYEVGPGGTLTSKGVLSSTAEHNLTDIEAIHTMEIGGAAYLVTTSMSSPRMTLWQVDDNTGALSETSFLSDNSNSALELDDVRGMDVVTTAGGSQYIVAAGGDDGIGSYRVAPSGQLEAVSLIPDTGVLRLNDVDWISSYTTTHGQSYVYAGGQDAGISVFRVGEDGTLTSVQNWVGGVGNLSDGTQVNAAMGNLRAGAVLENGMLAVGSNGSNMTWLFEIDEETGQIYLSASTATTAPEGMTAVGNQLIVGTATGLSSVTVSDDGGFHFRNAVDDSSDPAALNIQTGFATHTLHHNGAAYVIGSSAGGGVSVFRVTDGSGAPPTLTQQGIATANAPSQSVEAIVSVSTADGKTFIYTGGQSNGLNIFQMGADGSLTSLGLQTSTVSSNLTDIEAMVSVDTGGTDFVVTTSVGGNAMTLWEVNPATGGLTQRDYVADSSNTALELNDVRGMDVARMADGSQFIIAGGGDDGVSVFRIDPTTKTLVNTFNIADNTNGATELNDIDWVTSITTDGGTFAYVGGQDNGITVFRVNADGTLTAVQNFVNGTYTAAATGTSVAMSLGNLRAGDVNDGTGQLVVGSSGDGRVYFFNIDPATGMISLDRAVTVPGSTEGIDSIGDMSVIAHGNTISLTGGRPWSPDGIVHGSDGSDSMGLGYVDAQGDAITDGGDSIRGGAGNDTIDGAGGNDSIDGGAGADLVLGGDGDDLIRGGEDSDTLHGGAGGDHLFGEGGDDELHGDAGVDALYGGAGGDLLYGGADSDLLYGGTGDDTLHGDGGNDLLLGEDGADALHGGEGGDTLYGGAGRDTLAGGAGVDTLYGGADADVFVAEGADLIADFDAATGTGNGDPSDNDLVDLSAFYNDTTLAAWNAANPGQQYGNALGWLRADQADGVLDAAGGLRIQNGGTAVSGALLTTENTMVVCFAAGTRIATREGELAIEDLLPGDLILTMDNGYRPLRWIGSTRVRAVGNLAPILFRKGALANARDLLVSPQHRMLLSGAHAELAFGEHEVLAAARHLVNDHTILRVEGGEVVYYHMLFDSHEIVFAEGCASESFHPGETGLGALDEAARQEIFALFPQLACGGSAAFGATARLVLKGPEARLAMAAGPRTGRL